MKWNFMNEEEIGVLQYYCVLENCGIDYLINEIGRLCDGIFVKEKYLLGRL